MVRQQLWQQQHFSVITIGFHSIKWTCSHCVAAAAAVAMATQVNKFRHHSVWLWQWQNILHYIACYFATTAATQCEHFGSIAAEKPLPLPHRMNGPSAMTNIKKSLFSQ